MLTLKDVTQKEIGLAREWMQSRINSRGENAVMSEDMFCPHGVSVYEHDRCLSVVVMAYPSDAQVAFLGWVVTDPSNSSSSKSYHAVSLGIMHALIQAREKGYRHVVSLSGCRGVNRILDRMGFLNGDLSQTKVIQL